MPNKHAAEKDLRKSAKHALHNEKLRSYVKHLTSESRKALSSKPAEAAESVRKLQQALDKAAKIGILKANKAARRKSKIMKQLATLKK